MKRLLLGALAALLLACPLAARGTGDQPEIEARMKDVLTIGTLEFKDLDDDGELDPYEDWRLSAEERADDLVGKMTLEAKAGLMMIDTLNSEWGGKAGDDADDYINKQNMRRFIVRNGVTDTPEWKDNPGWGGQQVTARQMVIFTNTVQEMCESSRLGIPALFKMNPRNHYTHGGEASLDSASGSLSAWPKEAGLAATRDMDLIADFAKTVRTEWNSLGIRGMYGYMADLATEPRWYRVHECFTEDSELATEIVTTLIRGFQGEEIGSNSIVLTMKHFPGGGPQLDGLDPHYPFGREQVYPGEAFEDHLAPFKAAIEAGLASIMPYYGIPVGMQDQYKPADDLEYDSATGVGFAFNKGILTGLLREELGFTGNVNSDTGIIGVRSWGLEDYTE